jgi:hypothetical protein
MLPPPSCLQRCYIARNRAMGSNGGGIYIGKFQVDVQRETQSIVRLINTSLVSNTAVEVRTQYG